MTRFELSSALVQVLICSRDFTGEELARSLGMTSYLFRFFSCPVCLVSVVLGRQVPFKTTHQTCDQWNKCLLVLLCPLAFAIHSKADAAAPASSAVCTLSMLLPIRTIFFWLSVCSKPMLSPT